jgi:hypothetical protein
MVFGIGVGLGVFGVVFWQTRGTDTIRPATSAARRTQEGVPPVVAEIPKTSLPVAEPNQTRTTKTTIESLARQVIESPRAAAVQSKVKVAVEPPVRLEKQPSLTTESVTALPEVLNQLPTETTPAAGQPVTVSPENSKTFRNDPRIDLQALVWAPEAAARFVIINNQLIKEGGSVDNIVVVEINQDDVMLSEGSDRWHQEFNVR